ncbi:MAG: IS30 family transposase [Cyanobacteria bacterium P01_E01_bin.42]
MSHQHLSTEERQKIYELREKQKFSISEIAKILQRHKSTISRELKRNKDKSENYNPEKAEEMMKKRRKESKEAFTGIGEKTIKQIKEGLKKYHSPEQIAGRLKKEGEKSVSHETIYKGYKELDKYQKYLRQSRKKRRKRKSLKSKRGEIPGRIGIEERPKRVDEKKEIGHGEGDTVIGGNHQGAVVTYVDKSSKFLIGGLLKRKTMEEVNKVTLEKFNVLEKEKRKTITYDNGKEFSGHQKISEELGVQCYFARPYHSWERGLNEHTNGLLRQFFPKDTNFKIVTEEEVQKVIDLINNRPRKSLDYRTPCEVFYNHTLEPVAFQD